MTGALYRKLTVGHFHGTSCSLQFRRDRVCSSKPRHLELVCFHVHLLSPQKIPKMPALVHQRLWTFRYATS